MNLKTAQSLIQPAIVQTTGIWADLGAGTGMFAIALQAILERGTIYAIDKNPHALWRLERKKGINLIIQEGDFTQTLDLPKVDGIIMANALHYATDPVAVLRLVLQHLRPEGRFILIEYELNRPLTPWIPYPIPYQKFKDIARQVGLSEPQPIAQVPTVYGHQHIYSAYAVKKTIK